MKDPVERQIFADRQERAHDDPRRLEHFGFKVFSQSDEDGIIEEIFRRIGTKSKIFVDFGAEAGAENNSRYLLEQGWTGLWMESFPAPAQCIRGIFKDRIESGQLKFREVTVNAENINDLLRGAGLEGEIDFLSIDIDGNDYHVFKAIKVIEPRVVCLEYNPGYPPPQDWVMPYNPDHRWDGSGHFGASLVAFERLAASKGYCLVGCSLYSPNSYYVRSDLVDSRLFSEPFLPERFFNPFFYDRIVSFPQDVRAEILELRALKQSVEEKTAELAGHEIKAKGYREKIAGLKAKLAKAKEREERLRASLETAKKSRPSAWLPKWLRF